MKYWNWIILIAGLSLLSACTGSSYSKLRKEEKNLIANYISRNGYHVVYEQPSDSAFLADPKLYYRVSGASDDLYYRLEKLGDTLSAAVTTSQKVILRYKEYTLTQNPDTTSKWTTQDSPYPVEFLYLSELYSSTPVACQGWHMAVGLMQYDNSECKIICPSKLNNTMAQYSVTPYGYTLHIRLEAR